MGLSWQQGPLGTGAVGRFLTAQPLPERLLFAEPLRRRMRVKMGNDWLVDSSDVILLHEPGRYPVAYFNIADVAPGVLTKETRVTQHRDLGQTDWFTVSSTERTAPHAAWRHVALAEHASMLANRVAFAWRAMDAFYEEDERILGHAADAYHRIDIRQSSRHLVVRDGERIIADTTRPLVLFESGFAPRWYVPKEDVQWDDLTLVEGQTFCPYKGLASYYDIGQRKKAAWSYPNAYVEVERIAGYISFEADKIDVFLDSQKLALEPGQSVSPHGVDRGLDSEEVKEFGKRAGARDT